MSSDILVAWISAHGPITVTDAQLRDANPYLLCQSYDPATHTWTYYVQPLTGDPTTESNGS